MPEVSFQSMVLAIDCGSGIPICGWGNATSLTSNERLNGKAESALDSPREHSLNDNLL